MVYWEGRRYYSLDYALKEQYHEKLYKIALNGGMTCPNRDGTLDNRGCIFCSAGGSGDFAGDSRLSITEQLQAGKQKLASKYDGCSYIAYFQAYTNTYAPVSYLRKIFQEAIAEPEVKILSIATRPDCLPDDVIALLAELQCRKPVWVELGLQTIHEETARLIRRGYPLSAGSRNYGNCAYHSVSARGKQRNDAGNDILAESTGYSGNQAAAASYSERD